ncbi:MAG TPA: PAS domain-containing sensor histidine kinase [Anaerolineae bacterium]|nr:PAS domain-containing sensor histidine kinase [Anaerolineae bacterium]
MGIIYTILVAVVLAGLGSICVDDGRAYVAIVIAFGMASTSLIVDLLEKELKRTEAKFSIVFQESLDVSLVVDEANGQILDANRATRVTLGYENVVLISQPGDRLFPPEAPLSAEDLLHALQTQEAVFGSQMFQRADGTLCPMDLTATRIPWEEGHAVLLTLRDVTARKQAEEEIRRYQEHLEELVVERTAELMQANTDLEAYGHTVAHDLKNPLSTLIGFSDLLSGRYDSIETDQRLVALNAIAQSGRKMINIIDELLLLANVRQAAAVGIAPIEMEGVVKEALQRLNNLTQDYKPDIILPPQWPTAWGHPAWVEEVWTNYISNAIKYGGRPAEHIPPRVELGYDILDSYLPSDLTAASPNLSPPIRFWVRDNGKGLTFEEQARLFTPFTRLSEVRAKGHGLGLSIVKRIVEKCGGEVGVESIVGQGSTFYFTLPTAPTSHEKPPEKLFI